MQDLLYIKAYFQFREDQSIEEFSEKMKELALQGHPTAIARWYEFNHIGDCPKLDQMMINYNPQCFESMLAKGYYEKQTHNEKFNHQVKKATYLTKSLRYRPRAISLIKRKNEHHYINSFIHEEREDLKNNSYIYNFRQAYHNVLKLSNSEPFNMQKLALLARECQIFIEYTKQLPDIELTSTEKDIKTKLALVKIKKYLKMFALTHKELMAQKFDSTNYPQFYFAYASLIDGYESLTGKINPKLNSLRKEIFNSFSSPCNDYNEEENAQQ